MEKVMAEIRRAREAGDAWRVQQLKVAINGHYWPFEVVAERFGL